MKVICACGCGQSFFPSRATRFRIRNGTTGGFISGHQQRGDRNVRWNGGSTINEQGYRLIKAPVGHPLARKSGYILEHRLVMERHIGRTLLESEIVHHLNEDKLDNRVENLALTDHSEHATHHHTGQWVQPKTCPTCGKSFRKTWNQTRDQFCSRKCINGTAPKGEGHHAAKLTADLVRDIRRRAASGETQQSIANSINVKREAVGKVIRRERWTHIP